jgi:hypothetical protein
LQFPTLYTPLLAWTILKCFLHGLFLVWSWDIIHAIVTRWYSLEWIHHQ